MHPVAKIYYQLQNIFCLQSQILQIQLTQQPLGLVQSFKLEHNYQIILLIQLFPYENELLILIVELSLYPIIIPGELGQNIVIEFIQEFVINVEDEFYKLPTNPPAIQSQLEMLLFFTVVLIIVKLLLTEIPTTPPFFQTELILLLQINTLLIVQFTAYSSPIIVPTAHTEYESLRIVFRVEITSVIYESKHNGVKNPTIPTACMYEACNVNVTQEDNMINLPAKQPIKPYQSNLLNESMFYQIHIFYSYNVFQEITPQPNNRPEYRIYQVVQV
ncbi:Hypothetical_protein [Hexamita inflata]|uniref:Hypothetical_protein n=1 Tax=Hexamita inflata TaxID=28002 RepID=A0AA86NW70_9EUKA|nr:Hypothetical protein HINF_LOCUS13835 [Hexamita inflata]